MMITEHINISLKNPVIAGHIVYGQAILPGLAYIDLIYQVFRKHNYDYTTLELRDLTIHYPLAVSGEEEVQLSISCNAGREGKWQVLVEGSTTGQGADTAKRKFVTAEMHPPSSPIADEVIDIADVRRTAKEIISMEDIYRRAREVELVHTGFVKTTGAVYHTEEAAFIDITVGPEAAGSAAGFMFHPALVDGSAMGTGLFPVDENGKPFLFLPLFYESFYATELLQEACIARYSASRKKDLLNLNITFYNREGRKVARLKNFSNKLVKEPGQINPERTVAAPAEQIRRVPVAAPVVSGSNNEALQQAVSYLQQLMAAAIGGQAAQIDIKTGYYELGLSSASLLSIVETIGEKTGTGLSPILLFEHTTIAELAGYLSESYPQVFGAAAPATSVTRQEENRLPVNVSNDPVVQYLPENTDIAIIGIAGRYPGAENIAAFWENLLEGKDCITEVPPERWNWRRHEALRSPSGKILSRWGGFLKDVDRFDPAFFKISPRDAETMDPQERLFLEICWETMEDAGYTPKSLAGPEKRNKVGVFAGVMHKDYALIGAEAVLKGAHFPLSLNYAQIANRVSYCCNFHGPSMAVDTVCSSSLTAMHLALESIHHGESEVALAGGVNLSLHPDKYLSYGLMDLHASDGYCHAFGKGGDGYVSGECVAAVLLKPLNKAIQDQDHIYAVIKGSSINHGGTASGITVPSPVAQADMILSCLEKTGIHPRTISYVEAHGTGTSLGDPIEMQGLVKAYRQYTADKQYCAIGSVKSNIGHAEAAAGISGLSKAVLQLYHKTLTPSLHAQELNPYIDFASSPFYVQRERAVWHAPEITTGEGTKVLPRRAAVSSFGATGANAHIILEEYTPAPADVASSPVHGQFLVPLSAKNRERLQAYAAKLLRHLQDNPEAANPAALAFTLQTGRVALEHRIAFVTGDIAGLTGMLQAYVNGQTNIPGCFEGQLKAGQDTLQLFSGDEDWGVLVQQWLQKGQLKKAAELWVKGLEIDWLLLYPSGHPQRISLPAYPFARERYWIPENQQPLPAVQQQASAWLHPLLQQNTSDFTEQRFSSTFSGKEFFLADHVVQGRSILPGVAYLEMARAAVSCSMRTHVEENIQFRNIVWATPLVAGETPAEVHVGLWPEDNGEITYEVYADGAAAKTIYSKGSILLTEPQGRSAWNITDLQRSCNRRHMPGEECYRIFNDMGIAYGPAFQGIRDIYAGDRQLLAKIVMPAAAGNGQFILHPSILDAAMQTTLALRYQDGNTRPAMAFALRSCYMLQPCNQEMWAYTRYSDNTNEGDTLQRFDIDLCDEQGNICIQITGLSSRAAGIEAAADTISRSWRLTPVWEPVITEQELLPQHTTVVVAGASPADMTVIRRYYPQAKAISITTTDSAVTLQEKLESVAPFEHMIWVTAAAGKEELQQQEKEVLHGFRFMKALLQCQPENVLQYLTVVTRGGAAVSTTGDVSPAAAGIHGLVGALAKECPRWKVGLADMPALIDIPWKDILTLPPDTAGNAKAFRNGQWYEQHMLPLEELVEATPPVYRRRGVYVIIGGAGGVGTAWTEHMIRRYDAQVIWIGRRTKDATIQAAIDAMALLGTAPEYISADAGNKEAMLQAYRSVRSKYSQVNGVVHAAMVMHTRNIKSMEEEDFLRVSSAKIAAGICMAEVFAQEPLDFMLFFSSMVSFVKNAGQSGYAAGSLFADALARQLARSSSYAVKTINWGYWGSVGAVAGSEVLQEWTRKNEIGLIASAEAWEVLDAFLAAPQEQWLFHKITGPAGMNGLVLSAGALRQLPPANTPCLERISASALQERIPVPVVPPYDADMTAALCEVIWVLLRDTGLFNEKYFTLTDITPVVIPVYHRWLEESLEILAANGYLELQEDACTVLKDVQLTAADAWARWDAQLKQWPLGSSEKEWIRLTEVMLHALPQILTGKTAATDIMFRDASLDLVRGIYQGNEVADYFNEVLAQTIVAYLRDRTQQGNTTPVRILEIGAGTGATSAGVFRLVNDYAGQIGEYCFTDISKAFLFAGESMYGQEYPRLPITYKLLDISQPLEPQGFEPGSYDVVIAANVLHATRNITHTLRNTKALLSKHGLLLLNEVSSRLFFAHLTFGLLKGWWLTEDPGLRIQGCPGLYPHSWKALLEQEGMRHVWFPAQAAHATGQQIIVAESDGMIRMAAKSEAPVKQAPVKPVAAPAPVAAVDNNTDKEELIRKAIVSKLAVSLKIAPDKIDMDASFADYGLDSIIGLHTVQLLNEGMSLSLESTVLFDYSSVNRLAAYIYANHQPVLEIAAAATTPAVQPQPSTPAIAYQRRKAPVPLKAPAEEKIHREPVAIIGMSGKFAGADNVHQLWDYLREGTDLVEKVTRWDLSASYEEGETYCDQGSFIRDIAAFDPLFFNISGLEATYIDPQQRLFLEEAWKALEDAGYAGSGVPAQPRLWGVYVGSAAGDYQKLFKDKKEIPPQAFWGNLNSITPARIAYHLDLQGPAIAVDTACSSSLVAIHMACQGLWERETDMALAGGVFIQSTPGALLDANRAGMLSPGGRCFTFDNRADGFVLGEGVGAVVLKRLQDALKDGDHIYGVIRGSGINQDGTTNGITAPSAVSQERLESRIYEEFNINPADIQLVETHGTGTKLGDPIEFNALTRSFRKYTDRQTYCAIGSVKTNIGHVTAAAGVAGLVKVLLSMQHKMIPASLHFETGNTNIAFAGSPFYVNTALKKWETPDQQPRLAALSSFGLSGTNAHMIIEEAPQQKRTHTQLPAYMVVLSAHSAVQLRQQVTQLLDYCRQSPATDPGDMSYTLLLGRKHFHHRWAAVSSGINELIRQLEEWLRAGTAPQVWSGVLPETGRREDAVRKKQGEESIQRCSQVLPQQEYTAQLAVIADLYIQGYTLVFDHLFTAGYGRIPLPAYPFARDTYWVDTPAAGTPAGVTDMDIRMMTPVWEKISIPPPALIPTPARVLLTGGTVEDMHALQQYWPQVQVSRLDAVNSHKMILPAREAAGHTHLVWIAPDNTDHPDDSTALIAAQHTGVLSCFRLIRALLQKGYATHELSWTIITRGCVSTGPQDRIRPDHAALHGLCGAMAKEYPHWSVKVADLPEGAPVPWEQVMRLPADAAGNTLAWREDSWYSQHLALLQQTSPVTSLYRRNGVYVVIGGTGGIGTEWTEYMIRNWQAQVIWIGRRREDTAILASRDRLGALGVRPDYIQADATDADALRAAHTTVMNRYGRIHGVIQSAIVLQDQGLLNMEESAFHAVLRAKVDVSVHLAQVFGKEKPDFVLFFSAMNAFIKAPGQSNYAAGSTFEDAYARYLSQQWNCPVKTINWGYWGHTGIVSGEAYRQRMYEAGIGSITTAEAMYALEQLLAGSIDQIALIKTTSSCVIPGIPVKGMNMAAESLQLPEKDIRKHTAQPAMSTQTLKHHARSILRSCISHLLKITAEQIRDDHSFSALGVDSIIAVQLVARISKETGCRLQASILFDYSTVAELAQYMADNFRPELEAASQPPQTPAALNNTGVPVLTPGNTAAPQVTPSPATVIQKEPVAIIGISGRYPGSASLEELWAHLSGGDDLVTKADRWAATDNSTYYGGFLDHIDQFDPHCFNITALEASYMDPQQRLFLEESWKALENAGYTGNDGHTHACGVYVGCHAGDYQQLLGKDAPPQAFWGNAHAVIPARIAYHLNLQGPAMAIDTACSSSLVAIQQACQALWTGEIKMALAGGVFIQVTPRFYELGGKAGMLSPTGRCYSFDDRADGFIPGEGAGAVVLKKLSDAIADGDHIYGVIKGTAANQDGATNGITAPSGRSQERLIRQVYDNFHIHPENIGMVEAHGTATILGDPIEYGALTGAFRKYTGRERYCALGTIKTNIGHASAAAGIAGLSRVLLSLQHKQIPPSLHFWQGNSSIAFEGSPFYVNTDLQEWPSAPGHARQAALSAFGFSGTNVHMVIEEAPASLRRLAEKPAYLIVLSARTQAQLQLQVRQFLTFSEAHPQTAMGDMSYTLLLGRKHFHHRFSCVARNAQELHEALRTWLENGSAPGIHTAVLQEGREGEQESLITYGEECITICRQTSNAAEYRERLSAIASLYVSGYALPFDRLLAGGSYGRIPLPGYSFMRERYWVPEHPDKKPLPPLVPQQPAAAHTSGSLQAATEAAVQQLLASITGIAPARLEATGHFEELGLDSIMITQFSKGIEKWTGHLDTTLFFRYHTIRSVAKYLTDTYPAAMQVHDNAGVAAQAATDNPPVPIPVAAQIPEHPANGNGHTDIAVIGIAGRYPQADTLEAFWKNLYEGKDCIEEIPADRWSLTGFYEPDFNRALAEGRSYIKWGGFLKQVDCFDPLFFNISPRNAGLMDPQERLFLETAWACLEDAGYTRRSLEQEGYGNRIGVFAGATFNNYQLLMAEAAQQQGKEMYIANSQIYSIANRVSYVMNFTGPSLTVDTACSSSLQALHLACESIRRGESRMALAGGVNLSLHYSKYITLSQEQFGATDGHCRAFGEGGSGYVPAEGVGVVFLKPLQDAVADGDHIYGVIKGTAASHAGKTNGYTVPGPASQSLAIETALRNSNIDARSISCIEAHGTGTSLGDPIELAGLTDVFRKYTSDTGFCAISSVKSNIGHAEAAAGIAQLTKVLLQLKHQTLVSNLMHGQRLNPNIAFEQTPFVVQQHNTEWKRPVTDGREMPRRAGISSFGAGGANVHMIVEEYIPVTTPAASFVQPLPYLIVLSARNEDRLRMKATQLLDVLQSGALREYGLPDIAFTLQTGREAMDTRLAFTVNSMRDLEDRLVNYLAGTPDDSLLKGNVKDHKETLALLGKADDLQELLDFHTAKKQYHKLLELWVKGAACDWNKLYPAGKPARISLPVYPFAKERCWVGGTKAAKAVPAESPAADNVASLLTFEEYWTPAVRTTTNIPVKIYVCLLGTDDEPQPVVAVRPGTTTVVITAGSHYEKHSAHHYTIHPQDRSTYEAALQDITQSLGSIDALLYGWPLAGHSFVQDCTPVVLLLQALAATGIRQLRCLLTGSYRTGEERCYLESWSGISHSLGMTMPGIKMGIAYHEAGEISLSEWMQYCFDELQADRIQSTYYQAGQRYAGSIRPVVTEDATAMPIRNGGTYLITGGAGGLGLIFARHLAVSQPVNLLLTGRKPLDATRKAAIDALEALGSKVWYIQADIADEAAMSKGLQEALQQCGPLNGVIHAAGIASDKSILEKTPADFSRILSPKVAGTIVLEQLLKEQSPDFVCYFSSSSGILGDFGSGDYAMANRFLMAYARYRSQADMPGKTLVINWPLWREGGMQFDADDTTRMYLKSSGQRLLETPEGLAVFMKLLAQPRVQHLVIAGERDRVHRFLGLETAATVAVPQPAPVNDLPLKHDLPAEEAIEQDLKAIAGQLLEIAADKLDHRENLADLGFDSVRLTAFANRINAHYNIEITPALFFAHPTLEKLTAYFLNAYKETVTAFYAQPAVPADTVAPAADTTHLEHSTHAVPGVPVPVAITGMSGRFPQARNIDEMWNILQQGHCAVEEIPAERFDWRKYHGDPAEDPEKTNCRWSGFIPGVKEFDPAFFEISPREAAEMDPRQRLLMQEAWRALEDAGYGPAQLKAGKVGMFVGVEEGDYQLLPDAGHHVTANHTAILASRLAYFLDLKGPVMAINTACSSALAALHQACASLRNGECDAAVVAAVNLMLLPERWVWMSQAGMLSADGKCAAFSKQANGLVPGEAVAAIVLKRLPDATSQGDPVYAVISASGINYDGKTNGITAPGSTAQAALLRDTYDRFHISPEDIDYIVTHGTGTRLGDPVETDALHEVFKKATTKKHYCALTSSKTNFGHTLAASGLVSLISLVQALRHKTIPASLHCEEESDYVKWNDSPFYINKSTRPWEDKGKGVLTGAVSAFGFSGTNAHVVVQSHPQNIPPVQKTAPYYLLPLSATTEEALQEKINDMIRFLQQPATAPLQLVNISYTLIAARQHFAHRCMIIASSREEAIRLWQQAAGKEQAAGIHQGSVAAGFREQKAQQQYLQGMLEAARLMEDNVNDYTEILHAVADSYCEGYSPDWQALYGDTPPHRVHLPAYPFAREHYWWPKKKEQTTIPVVTLQQEPLAATTRLYEQLLDEVLSNDISIDMALQRIQEM
ncbi:SDR family NAD(P)-dependent oxidoreductase [Chitinophaga sp. Mgbs1]|uniref:SDR family NAD(P)-dependent oxidoreductase n=1 Tax=Chitinophaga solisilvae TaxID=1233460 RepID=A0A3S1B4V9_9BACT|nr:SDR family NAD(P)-dependent oxidoreductase [Chitinophaga solisilvae]